MEYKHSLQPKLQFPYSKCLQKLILKSTKNMLKKTVNIKFASSHVFLKKGRRTFDTRVCSVYTRR